MAAKPFIRDPSGILARVPELEEIAEEDRRVHDAIESGESHAVFSALRLGRLFGRIRKHAATASELLANRRLFLAPARGRLFLSTYNGIGASFYGERELDFVDQSYIATQFFVFFFVPLLPLGQYLVRNAVTQNGGSGYFVLGKVPFRSLLHLWSRLITLLVFSGVVVTLLSLLRSTQHNDFYVINELGVPIEAELAKRVLKVESGELTKIDLPTGTHDITIYGPARQKLETGQVRIRPGQTVIAWNVLGAAAIVHRTIEYRPSRLMSDRPPPSQIHCGERVIVYRKVDYPFQDPPKSLRTSGSGKTRTQLAVAERGPDACLRYLTQNLRTAEATALVVGRAQALHYALPAFERDLESLLFSSDLTTARELAKQGRAAHPGSVAHHRLYQNIMREAGDLAALRAEYEKPFEPPLSAADAAYLSTRLVPPGDDRLFRVRELASRFSDHGPSLAFAASAYCLVGDFASAVPLFERLRHTSPQLYRGDLELAATALSAIGRGREALELLVQEFNGGDDLDVNGRARARLHLAILHARVAERIAAAHADTLIRRLTGDEQTSLRAFARMLAGQLPPQSSPALPAEIAARWSAQEQAIGSPDDALRIAPKRLVEISGALALLIFTEAARVNAPGLPALRELLSQHYPPRFLDHLVRYVREGEPDPPDESNLTTQATLLFVRSRSANLPTPKREALAAAARRLLVLPGPLSRAMTAWASPR